MDKHCQPNKSYAPVYILTYLHTQRAEYKVRRKFLEITVMNCIVKSLFATTNIFDEFAQTLISNFAYDNMFVHICACVGLFTNFRPIKIAVK